MEGLIITPMRIVHFIFGDQLMAFHPLLRGYDPSCHRVAMGEVVGEASRPPMHKKKLVLFFSAMRHFQNMLLNNGVDCEYVRITEPHVPETFAQRLTQLHDKEQFQRLVIMRPGDVRVQKEVEVWASHHDVHLEVVEDEHFFATPGDFASFASERKSVLLEHFYRRLRKKFDILMDGDQPLGGQWNFDHDNRKSFGKAGPPLIASPIVFSPDDITKEVMQEVEDKFSSHPGSTNNFDYPVTQTDAQRALDDFLNHRLMDYGTYQDAMAIGHAYLFHARISAVMNLHLLDPRACIAGAVSRLEQGAPLNAVEGFVRQVLGWREFVRGVYFHNMPEYLSANELEAHENIPAGLWGGDTPMRCVSESMTHVLDHSYTHHIERLMVLGLYGLLYGVAPDKMHDWHMAMYADAIDWVSAPNVIGMSQYADGGYLASKPYCASGAYIDRMSDYCKNCEFNPKQAIGPTACPMTTLYWDFLLKHEARLKPNNRMGMQLKNLARKSDDDRAIIAKQADDWRARSV